VGKGWIEFNGNMMPNSEQNQKTGEKRTVVDDDKMAKKKKGRGGLQIVLSGDRGREGPT